MAAPPEQGKFPATDDVLHSLLEVIREPVSEHETLTGFVRGVLGDSMHVARVCVWTVEPETSTDPAELRLVASARPPGAVIHEEWKLGNGDLNQLPLTEPLIGRAVAECEPRWARDEVAWSAYPDWAKSDGIFAYYAVPILPDHPETAAFGALAVFHSYRFLDPQVHDHTLRRTEILADLLGTAILRARARGLEDARRDRLAGQIANARRARRAAAGHGPVLGASAAARRVREQIALAAHTAAPVLIQGEPGTGRTLAAHTVAAEGAGAPTDITDALDDCPLAELDAATTPYPRLEQELADAHEVARGGTLLIRDVDALPSAAQLVLLDQLERDGGEDRPVRVIATAGPGIREAVETGRFDPDLWNRLTVVLIDVPPLRARPDDIPDLAAHFAAVAARRLRRPPLQPTPQQLRALAAHPWPGNARELAAVMEHAVLTARGHRLNLASPIGTIAAAGLAPDTLDVPPDPEPIRTENEMRALLRENTLRALRCSDWKVSGPDGAAARLGIKATTLAARMRSMNIERPR